MKRCWFGGGLLILLLIGGIFTSRALEDFSLSLSENLKSAAALTREDRDAAQEKVNQARAVWESRKKFAAFLADHAPMEQIDEHFALLVPEAEEEDFREVCLRLSKQLQALGHSQMLTLENLL